MFSITSVFKNYCCCCQTQRERDGKRRKKEQARGEQRGERLKIERNGIRVQRAGEIRVEGEAAESEGDRNG